MIKPARDYETATKDKYFNAKKENAKAPYQRKDDLTRYSNFCSFRRQHREGRLNLDDYILEILYLSKFEPKKKYVEELEDTFESDGTSISNSSTEEERNDDFNEGEQPNMDAASQASLFTEVTDEELDRYLEQVDACSSSHS